jgi:hypothetical protein
MKKPKTKVFRFTMQEVLGQDLGRIEDIAFKQRLAEDALERDEEEEVEETLTCPETCALCRKAQENL